MAFDPSVSLAIAMAAGPGQYALLIGSGVSRSAGIPTGWEVTLDLVSQIARAQNGDAPADPESWWKEHRSDALEYSMLLEELAPQPAERSQLLHRYFEPTDEEREAGTKVPSPAHRAIAKLVSTGVVRIIVTTNFDRLLERAIQDEGTSPVVISTPDQAEGASPIVHNACTIVKLNGDYLDSRIKNSEAELASYDPRIDALLHRILDEYGLVVCGWSAEWDSGLRTALDRVKSRRYTTYWAVRGELGTAAAILVTHCGAVPIRIDDADRFFGDLADKVATLRDSRDDPESIAVAVAQLKRYLPRPGDRIRYADLMRATTEDLVRATSDEEFPVSMQNVACEECLDRMDRYEGLADRLLHLLATAAYWGEDAHLPEIVELVRRLTEAAHTRGGRTVLVELLRYPALLAMYVVGIALVDREKYSGLNAVLSCDVRIDDERRPLVTVLSLREVADQINEWLRQETKERTPMSNRLHENLRPAFAGIIPADDRYQDAFDRFEYLQTLTQEDYRSNSKQGHTLSGGCFEWRGRPSSPEWPPDVSDGELERDGPTWAPLQAGMFGGEMARVKRAKKEVDDWLRRSRW